MILKGPIVLLLFMLIMYNFKVQDSKIIPNCLFGLCVCVIILLNLKLDFRIFRPQNDLFFLQNFYEHVLCSQSLVLILSF